MRFPADVAPRNDIVVDNHVPVRMRDGVTLYADVYRPTGSGRHPVLLSITPYSTERFPTAYDAAVYFAQRGYVYVFQDVRGRHESEGVWVPFVNDEKDAYDTIEWAAKQPWSDGKVGDAGRVVSRAEPVARRAGRSRPAWSPSSRWSPRPASTTTGSRSTAAGVCRSTSAGDRSGRNRGSCRTRAPYDRWASRDPLRPGPAPPAAEHDAAAGGRHARFYDDWLANPDYNAYWKPFNVEEQFDKIAIPVHTFGGWFDIFSQGTLRGYVGMSQKGATDRARRGSNLVIGPWGHGPTQKFGALDFGPTANVDALTLQLRWYDYWLKEMDNGLASEAPVKLFVMGRNAWVYEREYPLARTDYRPLYFSSGGSANAAGGDGRLTWTKPAGASPSDRFRYDPNDPVPSVGGNNCCGTPTAAGPQDQRPIEGRRDVLIYTTDVLQEEIEVTGPVKVVLYAASDATDTDFVAKLVDVHPDGSSYNMAEGIVRARYRESLTSPKLLTPGEVNRFEIDLVGTSVAFLKGHRIRVHVTSSHFPQFDRNPNTGAAFGTSAAVKVAEQTIYHDAARASHVLLPVIPRRH